MPLRLESGPEGALVALDVRTRQVLALVGQLRGRRAAGSIARRSRAASRGRRSSRSSTRTRCTRARFTPATIARDATRTRFEGGYKPEQLRGQRRHGAPAPARGARQQRERRRGARARRRRAGQRRRRGRRRSASRRRSSPTCRSRSELRGRRRASWPARTRRSRRAACTSRRILVTRIVGPDGKDVPLPPRPPPRRVLDDAEAYVMTSLLTSVIDHGTGARARAAWAAARGQDRHEQPPKDTWFAGYSTDIAARVDRLRRRAPARRARSRGDARRCPRGCRS